MSFIPAEEIDRRIAALQASMGAANPPLDALILVQSIDVYYASGTFQNAHVILPASGKPRLLVRRVLERAQDESPLLDVRPMMSLKDLPGHLRDLCGPPPWRLGFELDVLPVRQLQVYQGILGPDGGVQDASDLVLDARSVKSPWEIKCIREAGEIMVRVFQDLPSFLQEDISTHELQALLDCRARILGHPGLARLRGLNSECPISVIVSGPSGAAPSHTIFPIGGEGIDPAVPLGGDLQKIRRDVPVAIDCLGFSAGYHADQTRMAVKGRLPAGAGRIYSVMLDVLRHCETALRPGAIPSEVYNDCLGIVRDQGLADGFLGLPGYAVAFVGHSIGLEVNELPVLAPRFDKPLRSGMVLAVEPKFTHPDWGVIGIENTYVLNEGGLECLTPIPETVIMV